MDMPVLLLGLMTVTLVWVSFHAWRIGNERRDVALLGAFGGVFGLGTVVALLH
jgi:hypothetical protein